MADDELDTLYSVQPGAFTAQRTKLTAAAKRRGDEDAAKQISAARKPTTAAWVVNRLAIRDREVKQRLADLGERLRAAHAAMDGHRIRELSAEQHRLIEDLTRAAFDAVDITPSAAVREDVTSTLQAAIADRGVRAQLGRLSRPEQWSGFGDVSDVVASAPAKSAEKSADQRLAKLRAAVTAAERAKAQADDVRAERQAARDAARLRRDEALADLRRAERELDRSEKNHDKAKQASREAAESLELAKAQLKRP